MQRKEMRQNPVVEKQCLFKKKANRSDCLEHTLCQGNSRSKARKVGWGQIMEGFEYQTDESELCSVGSGELLKILEPQNDVIKGALEED